ncbi:MAG TPA: two-component regulator propeller domain-containing protein [Vicinamibacterales bacterium]|nr:two-component regulator propeller domain-containing protein [Vicinamibacterales bacterium]
MLVVLLCAPPIVAEPREEAPDPAGYTLTAWTAQDDVLLGDVLAIAEDRDGYLWLGTNGGLVRFDGASFVKRPLDDEAASVADRAVTAVLGARDGSLWVGHGGAGGVQRLKGDVVTRFSSDTGLFAGSIAALAEDRDGIVWAAGRGGLAAFRGDKWERIASPSELKVAAVYSVYEDRGGRLWIGTSEGVFSSGPHGFELRFPQSTFVQDFAQDRSGAMWVTDTRETIARLETGEGPIHAAGAPVPQAGWGIAADRRGNLWIAGLGGGLLRLNDQTTSRPTLERFAYEQKTSGSPRTIFTDRDGNVWVGMRAGGLLRVSENWIRTDFRLDGLTNDGVRAIRAAPDGAVWVATGHSLNRFVGGTRSAFPVSQTRALNVDAAGTLWVSTARGFGRFDAGAKRFVASDTLDEIQWEQIMAVGTDAEGAHWLCSQQGVIRQRGNELERVSYEAERGSSCNAILMDSRGRVWTGFSPGGLAVYESSGLRRFTEADGLASGAVLSILEDQTGDIWIETTAGISRVQEGRVTTMTRRNGPFANFTSAFVQDDDGFLWVGIDAGAAILRFHRREMDRVAADPSHDVEYRLFDRSDGLQGEVAWQPSRALGARGTDGRLWFASGATLIVIDPRSLPPSPRPVAPRIDAVWVDRAQRASAAPARLPSGPRELSIDWSAISLGAASKLRFRYRLEGYDREWVYAGARRNVTYNGLAAGRYRFKVSATYDGVWTDGEDWDFIVPPPFYLSAWFLMLAGLSIAAVIASASWLRVRMIRERYALVFAERALVSREIHDTLLQNLAAIGLELQGVMRQLEIEPQRVRLLETLRRLHHQTAHSLKEGRDLVSALRRTGISKAPGLVETLREFAAHTSAARGTPVLLTVDGAERRCSADVELQILRICQEAVSNAIVHGHASTIEIALAFAPSEVALRVRDDGCGFDVNAAPPDHQEHLGLLGMEERAERIDARLSIQSTPGTGAVVEVVAPS